MGLSRHKSVLTASLVALITALSSFVDVLSSFQVLTVGDRGLGNLLVDSLTVVLSLSLFPLALLIVEDDEEEC